MIDKPTSEPGRGKSAPPLLAAAMAAGAGVVAAVVLGGLAGCSGDASGNEPVAVASGRIAEDPDEAVRAAPDVLRRWGSSRTRTSMEMATGGTLVTIVGKGTFDYTSRQGQLSVTLPETAGMEQGPITELVVPGAVYMRNRGAGVPTDKWVRVRTARLADGNLVTGGATDPVTAADLLRGARDVRLVGTERLDGVRVRHFRGAADMLVAAGRAPDDSAKALRAAARSFTVSRVPFDVYLDENGRLRRVRQVFRFRSASGAPGVRNDVRVVSVTELFDFGSRASFSVPRSADIWNGKIVSPAASGTPGS
ncbi:hypothetical protein [Wenjunlia tyrosinilytica]|uniref:Lipoprotein n=1 Tax=Wenjunlia tyrosinilytica TaxID=1544741 RepID=A0A917ZQF9_9ACTN|nr:hypothetical protein [Wenjunlia tyrosinilytica]GGO87351.1 lipoprotein [Wenjunlia tyrosinilytica]